MSKTILLTGATDGIGLEAALMLASAGHGLLLHGRSAEKLAATADRITKTPGAGAVQTVQADLSRMADVEAMATEVMAKAPQLDVLINNAGVYKTGTPLSPEGLDVRFLVNTLAPYLLTKRLLPALAPDARVVNLSSAAQATVDLKALAGSVRLSDGEAYAQSKLAITMWTAHWAQTLTPAQRVMVAVNPASLLGSKMVKEAFGIAGHDLRIGADIILRAALSDHFAQASGRYFDNDSGQFADPHPDALDASKNERLVAAMEALLDKLGHPV
ncbi:MAG: SDR family NAD(P)-dependent oxidoreductase [Rhodospirillaceae bacterium]